MRLFVRMGLVVACLVAGHTAAFAQAALSGIVRDTSGAVLPGVTVEAASPALIEKVRTAVTDSTGRYRIENLQPGTYSVTFTLPGFANIKREGVAVSGTGVIAVDGEMRVGGVQETITVTGETPVVDTQSTKREITLDNETMRSLPSVRSYSYLLTTVPGLQTNVNNVNSGPVFAIFPIHGGRGVESRLTVEGMNISNPPGGNQPPNYVADIGNAQEVTMTTSGGLGESETAGLTMNIVPRSGGNNLSGLFFLSGFSEGMQSSNYTTELQQRAIEVEHVDRGLSQLPPCHRIGATAMEGTRGTLGDDRPHHLAAHGAERRGGDAVELVALPHRERLAAFQMIDDRRHEVAETRVLLARRRRTRPVGAVDARHAGDGAAPIERHDL